MRGYLTMDFLISLGMFFTTVIILSHIIKPINANQGKLILSNTEKSTTDFFNSLTQKYTNATNNIILNYSVVSYIPYFLANRWKQICTLYNSSNAICISNPCPIKFYGPSGTPYYDKVPDGATSVYINQYFFPVNGFLMPYDRFGNNITSINFDERFYNDPTQINIINTNLSLHLPVFTNNLLRAQNYISKRACARGGCIIYDRITFTDYYLYFYYFIFVKKCREYCMIFVNGRYIGGATQYTGIFIPNNILRPYQKNVITVAAIVNGMSLPPVVDIKLYRLYYGITTINQRKCYYMYVNNSHGSNLIIYKNTKQTLKPANVKYRPYEEPKPYLFYYKKVNDKPGDGEIFVNGMVFYSDKISDSDWSKTNDTYIQFSTKTESNCVDELSGECATTEEINSKKICIQNIPRLEKRAGKGNDALFRIHIKTSKGEDIKRIVVALESDDGPAIWLNGLNLLYRVHDNGKYTSEIYFLGITNVGVTKRIYLKRTNEFMVKYRLLPVDPFRHGDNILAIWVSNGGDDNWGCGVGDIYLLTLRIYGEFEV